MLRRQSVRHTQHVHISGLTQNAARFIVRVEITDHEAAAVEIHEQWLRRVGRCCRRHVVTRVEWTISAIDRDTAHFAHACRSHASVGCHRRDLATVPQAGFNRCRPAEKWLWSALPRCENKLHMRIEGQAVAHQRCLANRAQQPRAGQVREHARQSTFEPFAR